MGNSVILGRWGEIGMVVIGYRGGWYECFVFVVCRVLVEDEYRCRQKSLECCC